MPYRLGEPMARTSGLRQFQIVWDGTRMQVRLVFSPAAPCDVAARVRHDLAGALAAGGAVPPSIDVRAVEALEREPGHAAKLKLIKSVAPYMTHNLEHLVPTHPPAGSKPPSAASPPPPPDLPPYRAVSGASAGRNATVALKSHGASERRGGEKP
jgi:hypothetical protein